MKVSPLDWMSIGKDERQTPLGAYQWEASFWKMSVLVLFTSTLITISYLMGKDVASRQLRAIVQEEVKQEVGLQMQNVNATLASINAKLEVLAAQDVRRDKKLDMLMMKPAYAPRGD